MSAVTLRRKNMNRIELVPMRGDGGLNTSGVVVQNNSSNNNNNTTLLIGEGATSKALMNSSRDSIREKKFISPNQNRPCTTSSIFSMTSSVKSARIIENRSSLIKKANDRFAHKKMAISDKNSTFPGVNEYRFAREKEDIMESVLDKINNLSNHSYFTCSEDSKSQKGSDLCILGKAPSIHSQQSTDSQLSTQSHYQRQYIEWKNAKEINESSKHIADTIKKREGHVPFGTFGVFQTGSSVYKKDFVTESAYKKRMNEIEIEEGESYILNNPWEKSDDGTEEENKEDNPTSDQTIAALEDSNKIPPENEGNNNCLSRACTPMIEIDKRSTSPNSFYEEDPPEIIGEEPQPEGQHITMINVTKPTDFDATSVFSCSSHQSLYSRRYAPSTCSSTFSTGKKGIKGGKAKYMPRPMTTSLIESRLKTSLSSHSNNPQIPPQTPSSPLSKSLNIDEMRNNHSPISSRHNFPQGRKNTFNSVIRSSDLLSTN